MNEVYNCDFIDVLQNLDEETTIISDPPYNINFKYNEYSDKLEFDEYTKMISNFKGKKCVLIGYHEQFFNHYLPALGTPDHVVTWCYNSNIGKQSRLIGFWNVCCDLSADYQPYKNPNDKRVKALIEKGKKGAKLYDWWSDIQLVKNVHKQKEGINHPCPVPVDLIRRIIKVTHAEKVFDPFLGSGTTAIASIREKVSYSGAEIDEQYYGCCLKRINNELQKL